MKARFCTKGTRLVHDAYIMEEVVIYHEISEDLLPLDIRPGDIILLDTRGWY